MNETQKRTEKVIPAPAGLRPQQVRQPIVGPIASSNGGEVGYKDILPGDALDNRQAMNAAYQDMANNMARDVKSAADAKNLASDLRQKQIAKGPVL